MEQILKWRKSKQQFWLCCFFYYYLYIINSIIFDPSGVDGLYSMT